MQVLQHLLDHDDYDEPIEPYIERGALASMLRSPRNARDELKAKTNTIAVQLAAGMELALDDEEETVAMQQFNREIQQMNIQPAGLNRPAVVLKLTALLSEYDHEVVRDAVQMRQYVTNRLLEESDPKQPGSLRLRALDMLGKINGVDLFTERTEITVRTMPMESLEARLHEKLRVLLPEDFAAIEVESRAQPHE